MREVAGWGGRVDNAPSRFGSVWPRDRRHRPPRCALCWPGPSVGGLRNDRCVYRRQAGLAAWAFGGKDHPMTTSGRGIAAARELLVEIAPGARGRAPGVDVLTAVSSRA